MCGGSGGGGNGGRSGGGGGSLPDNQQPGEVVREANKANAPQITSQQLANMHIDAVGLSDHGSPEYNAGMKKFVTQIKAKGITEASFPKTDKGESDWRFVERSIRKFG